ncbi:MAG: ATP-binding protein [Planctomycetota bacterium]
MFEAGFVGSNQVPEGEGGAGVGLALARRVVESHGGSIWVESERGRGSRISLSVPRG